MTHSDLHDVLPEESWMAVRTTINRMLMNGPIGIVLGMDRTDDLIETVVLAIATKFRALENMRKRSLQRGGLCPDHRDKLKDGVCSECNLEWAVKVITHLLEGGSYDDDGDYILCCGRDASDPHPALARARTFIQHMMNTRGTMGDLINPQDYTPPAAESIRKSFSLAPGVVLLPVDIWQFVDGTQGERRLTERRELEVCIVPSLSHPMGATTGPIKEVYVELARYKGRWYQVQTKEDNAQQRYISIPSQRTLDRLP